jgi:hypothetical protein
VIIVSYFSFRGLIMVPFRASALFPRLLLHLSIHCMSLPFPAPGPHSQMCSVLLLMARTRRRH